MLYYRIETAHTSERICKQVFSVGDYITAMKRGRTGSKEVKATKKQYLQSAFAGFALDDADTENEVHKTQSLSQILDEHA